MKVKNIVFSGFMATILSAGAANAINVASQGYVDSKVGTVSTAVSTLESTVSETYQTKADAATAATEVTQALEGKADKGTTLAAYGIDDAYTKTAADEKFMIMNNETALGANLKWEGGKLTTDGIATTTGLSALESAVDTLKGGEDVNGSVANKIATALGDYSTTSEMETAIATATENMAKTSDVATAKQEAIDAAGSAADSKISAALENYTTTADLTETLEDYALNTALQAEAEARVAADEATTEALKDYTKTSDLDAGFITEAEMTTFKSTNDTAIADAKKAGTDAMDALEEYEATNDAAVSAAQAAADKAQGEVDALEGTVAGKADKATTLAGYGIGDAYTKSETDGLIGGVNSTIGEVESGKTVVGMIAEAQSAATYDDTALAGRVSTAEGKITTIEGQQTTQDGKISELETSLGTTSSGLDALTTRVGTAEGEIDTLQGLVGDTAVATQIANSAINTVKTGTENGTIEVDGSDVAVKGLGTAAYTASTAYDAAGSAAQALADAKTFTTEQIEALSALANFPVECATAKCALTNNGTALSWEVVR